MKRTGVLVLFGILLLCNGVWAISSTLKENYELGETIIAEIKGNIAEPISKEQIDFLRGHVSVPFDFDFKKIGERYFLWASTPEKENNYTLAITGIVTSVSGNIEKIDFRQNFSVRGNLTDYSIKPGFITTDKDFDINVQLNRDAEQTISVEFPARDFVLKPGITKITFSVEGIAESKSVEVKIGKYTFPAYIIVEKIVNITPVEKILLGVNPLEIKSTVLASEKEKMKYPFQIVNLGNKSVEKIKIEYDEKLFSIEGAENLNLSQQGSIELNLKFIGEITDEIKKEGISDTIVIEAGDYFYELPIMIIFTENETKVETPYLKNYTKLEYCSELDGKICNAVGESCNGKTKQTVEGPCCVEGACVVQDNGGGSYGWIGWVIAGVILIVIIYAFLRYKKAKGTDEFAKITGKKNGP